MGVIISVGIDLAKNIFSVHGVDAHGKTVAAQDGEARGKLLEADRAVAQLPGRHKGRFGGAHQMACDLQRLGHDPRIMMPKFVIGVLPQPERTTATMPRRFSRGGRCGPACAWFRSKAPSSRRC